jgi:acid phosphatase (class A)
MSMKRKVVWQMAAVIGVALCSPLIAQIAAPKGPGLPPEFRAYFIDSGLHRDAISPAPANDSAQDMLDRTIFRQTRALDGSPRWALAQADGGKGALKAFSCAAGVTLTAENVPALVTLLSRYRTDLINLTRTASPRPYQRDIGPTCLTDKALTMASGTPTIQSAWGWTLGLILSEAIPARTDALMARARAYGQSAAVCGYASASEVAAGRDLAAPMLARARAQGEFSVDLERARTQIAAIAARGGPAPEGCEAEKAVIEQRPF